MATTKQLENEEFEPIIIAFCCNWCSLGGADMAGLSRMQQPTNVRIIRTMCSARVDPIFILQALTEGADGVLFTGCHPGDCHYLTGNYKSLKRFEYVKYMLEQLGLEPDRVRLEWISASEGGRWAETVREFTEQIRELGPNPLKNFQIKRNGE